MKIPDTRKEIIRSLYEKEDGFRTEWKGTLIYFKITVDKDGYPLFTKTRYETQYKPGMKPSRKVLTPDFPTNMEISGMHPATVYKFFVKDNAPFKIYAKWECWAGRNS